MGLPSICKEVGVQWLHRSQVEGRIKLPGRFFWLWKVLPFWAYCLNIFSCFTFGSLVNEDLAGWPADEWPASFITFFDCKTSGRFILQQNSVLDP